jgi:hypothetical protein
MLGVRFGGLKPVNFCLVRWYDVSLLALLAILASASVSAHTPALPLLPAAVAAAETPQVWMPGGLLVHHYRPVSVFALLCPVAPPKAQSGYD